MKINPHHESPDLEATARAKADLTRLLAQPTSKAERPCSGCTVKCSCPRNSADCTCRCSSKCPEAARQLSSDPERYPIEAGVVPFVYGLASLRLMPPCWSCEGHLRDDGSLLRLPKIWFHADSIIYPHLLLRVLSTLLAEKVLDHPWRIELCNLRASGALNSTFQIEPDYRFGDELTPSQFARTQRDMIEIGNLLESRVRGAARQELDRL